MRVITIYKRGARYYVSGPSGASPRSRIETASDLWSAGNAAAAAINWGRSEATPYCIVGEEEALAQIPQEVRCKNV